MGTTDGVTEEPAGGSPGTPPPVGDASRPPSTGWVFITNHGLVLLAIARHRDITLREVATRVGITERSAQNIVADLVDGGYLSRTRQGRRNSYTITGNRPLRHPLNAGHDLNELLALLVPPTAAGPAAESAVDQGAG